MRFIAIKQTALLVSFKTEDRGLFFHKPLYDWIPGTLHLKYGFDLFRVEWILQTFIFSSSSHNILKGVSDSWPCVFTSYLNIYLGSPFSYTCRKTILTHLMVDRQNIWKTYIYNAKCRCPKIINAIKTFSLTNCDGNNI